MEEELPLGSQHKGESNKYSTSASFKLRITFKRIGILEILSSVPLRLAVLNSENYTVKNKIVVYCLTIKLLDIRLNQTTCAG